MYEDIKNYETLICLRKLDNKIDIGYFFEDRYLKDDITRKFHIENCKTLDFDISVSAFKNRYTKYMLASELNFTKQV